MAAQQSWPGTTAHAAEQPSIPDAVLGMRGRLPTAKVLDGIFVKSLHRAMHRDVWNGASTYRTTGPRTCRARHMTQPNIGVESSVIANSR